MRKTCVKVGFRVPLAGAHQSVIRESVIQSIIQSFPISPVSVFFLININIILFTIIDSFSVPPIASKPAVCVADKDSEPYTTTCTCEGKGYPPPNIYWTKNGNATILSTTNTLKLTVEAGIDGTYTCNLNNSVATTPSHVTVSFYGEFLNSLIIIHFILFNLNLALAPLRFMTILRTYR